MPGELLRSQFEALEPLEPDERGLMIEVGPAIATIVDAYLARRGS